MINVLSRYYPCFGFGLIIGMLGNPVNLTIEHSGILIAGVYFFIIVAGRVLRFINDSNAHFCVKTTLVGTTTILVSIAIGFFYVNKVLQI